MALRPFYTAETDIPEALKSFYEKPEGSEQFVLQVEADGGFALEDVAGLKSTLGKLKDRATKAEGSLKGFSALEKEPTELLALLEELTTLQTSQGDESEAIAGLKTQMENLKTSARTEMEKSIAPIQALSDSRLEQLKGLLIDARLSEAIIAEGGSPKLLMPVLKNEVRARTDDNGNVIVEIVDSEGTPRITGADLNPMSFADLVQERKLDTELSVAFSANGHSGGGTKSDTTTTTTTGTRTLSATEADALPLSEYRKAKENGLIPG